MSIQPFTRREGPSGDERDTTLRTVDGVIDTRNATPVVLATIPVPADDCRFAAAIARGRNVITGESFAINIASTFENTGGVVSAIVPDNGDDPPAYNAREDTDIALSWVPVGDAVELRFVGHANQRVRGAFHVEVL